MRTIHAPHGIMKPQDGDTMPTPPRDGRQRVIVEPRTIWLAAAVALGLAVLYVLVTRALDILILLFIALIIAEAIRPAVAWLRARRVPRPLGVLLIYSVALGVLGLLGWLVSRPLVAQASTLIDALPTYATRAQDLIDQAERALGQNPQAEHLLRQLGGQVGGLARQLAPLLVSVPAVLVSLVANALLALVLAFFWLTVTDGLKEFVVGLFPRETQETASAVIAEMSRRVGGYLRGVAVNMVVIGALSGVGVWLLGLPYALVLGVLAGLTELIPIIGPFLGGAPAVLLALVMGNVLLALEVVALYTLIQQIEGNTLVPLVMERVVKLNPLTVLVAVLFGTALLGIVGAVLAVPAAAVLQVLVTHVLAPAARRASARVSARSAVLAAGRDNRKA